MTVTEPVPCCFAAFAAEVVAAVPRRPRRPGPAQSADGHPGPPHPILLPGIPELSRRARYYSSHAWLLDTDRDRKLRPASGALSIFIKVLTDRRQQTRRRVD